jgi:hypothetical protein
MLIGRFRPFSTTKNGKKSQCLIMKQLNPEHLLKENVHEEAE